MDWLKNPSFDSAATSRNKGEMGVEYAEDWVYGWQDNKTLYDGNGLGISDGSLRRLTTPFATCSKLGTYSYPDKNPILKPEFNVIAPVIPHLDPARVYGAKGKAIHCFKQWGIIEAWIYQTVKVDPFKSYRVRFSAFAHAWFRSDDDINAGLSPSQSTGVPGPFFALRDTPGLTDPQRNYLFDVGIDPLGGKDATAASVVWGQGAHIVNVYHEIPQVEAMVGSGIFTVFIRVRNLYGFNNSDAYIDNALLDVTEIPPSSVLSLDYVALPFLPPQDSTLAELNALQEFAFRDKRDVLRSYDSARAIVKAARPGSRVILVGDLIRHPPGVVEWLGVEVEQIAFPEVDEPEPPPPPPAVEYPRTLSCAGVHTEVVGSHTGYGDMLRACSAEGRPLGLVKTLMDAGTLMEAKYTDTRTITIFRTRPISSDLDNPVGDWLWPIGSTYSIAQDWMESLVERAGQDLQVTDYLEITNEPNGTSEIQFRNQNDFYMACIEYANTFQIKIAIGGFSAGCPEPWQVDVLAPCFAEAARHGHIVATHDGSFNGGFQDGVAAGTALRYRMIKQRMDALGLPMPGIAITEAYWPDGYKGARPYSDMKWYLSELAKDEYVIGMAWFSLGSHGGTNIVGQLKNFTQAILEMPVRTYGAATK